MYTDPGETLSTTLNAAKLHRLGTRRLTRAHLAIEARPDLTGVAQRALEQMCGALEHQLGCAVSAKATLLPAASSLGSSLSRASAFALLELSALGTPAVLEIESTLLSAVLERLSGGTGKLGPLAALTRIEEVAFSYLCLVCLSAARGQDAIQRLFGPRLVSVHTDKEEVLGAAEVRQRQVAIEVLVTVGTASGAARLLVPAESLYAGLQAFPAREDREIAPEVLAASILGRAFLGRSGLSLADLQNLVPGDVVLIEGLSRRGEQVLGPVRISTRGFDLLGELRAAGFELYHARSRAIPQRSVMAARPHDPVPELPVDIEVELTKLRLALSELALLKPGAVLSLHINASQPVLLRIGDRAVARAELVEIEGEVGARILALLS